MTAALQGEKTFCSILRALVTPPNEKSFEIENKVSPATTTIKSNERETDAVQALYKTNTMMQSLPKNT